MAGNLLGAMRAPAQPLHAVGTSIHGLRTRAPRRNATYSPATCGKIQHTARAWLGCDLPARLGLNELPISLSIAGRGSRPSGWLCRASGHEHPQADVSELACRPTQSRIKCPLCSVAISAMEHVWALSRSAKPSHHGVLDSCRALWAALRTGGPMAQCVTGIDKDGNKCAGTQEEVN